MNLTEKQLADIIRANPDPDKAAEAIEAERKRLELAARYQWANDPRCRPKGR